MRVPARTGEWIAPIALALFALALRVLLIWRTGFDGLYGQDPFAYFDYAAAFKSALAHGQWPPPFFWPIGYPALAAALSTILPLSLAAQVVSILSGVSVAALTFLIVREILGDRPHAEVAALFAGVIGASAGQLLISSLSTMSDAASLFWATLSAYGMLRFRRTHARRWMALAAFALGWAVMTRLVYGLLIPVWAIALGWERQSLLDWARVTTVAVSFGLLALLPQLILFGEYAGRGAIEYIGEAQIYSWNLENAFQSDIVNADGHFKYPLSVGGFYTLPLIYPDYVAIWFTPLILLGAWALRDQRASLLLLLGWFVIMWGFLIGVEWENWRFPLAFFLPLTVLAGVGLQELFERLRTRPAHLIGAWLGIGLVVTVAWGVRDADSFIVRQLDERSIVSWVNERVPVDATLLTFGETATLEHYTSFRVVELATESPDSVQQIARDGKDIFVLLNVENVESQWQGLPPQLDLSALQDHFVLHTIASRGAYILYSVGSER